MELNLSVVIVTYDSERSLPECLAKLDRRQVPEVLVIDNASRDRTVEIARRCGARVRVNSSNLGFACGCNQGARESGHETVCFLNPDCEVDLDLLREGCRLVAGGERVCAVAPLVEPEGRRVAGRQPGYTRLKLIYDTLHTHYGALELDWLRKRKSFHDPTWSWPHGACLFAPRDRFLELGGFDTAFFMYMEDVDFGLRWSEAGDIIVELEHAAVHHQGSGSAITHRHRLALLDQGRRRYAGRRYGPLFAMLLGTLSLPARVARALISAIG
jgi:GT2 family glycosyltransferase